MFPLTRSVRADATDRRATPRAIGGLMGRAAAKTGTAITLRDYTPVHARPNRPTAATLGTQDTDRIAANFRRLAFDPRQAHIGCPLLVLHGGHDVLFGLDAQQPFLEGAGAEDPAGLAGRGPHHLQPLPRTRVVRR